MRCGYVRHPQGFSANIHFSKEAPYDYETAYTDKRCRWPLWGVEFNSDVFPAHRGLFVISTITTEAKIGKVITV